MNSDDSKKRQELREDRRRKTSVKNKIQEKQVEVLEGS